ncbi:fused MFS/spermidine synthase [Methyloterricola oryzae]|uniref:fused MFS/spermidine synthase n=1 Tax=Methyloterricola oryzae TaxID=1495050 RepID=UPI0005EB0B9E|nr:fused MFS/spermidine synthase [Methyloterricola oryzae]
MATQSNVRPPLAGLGFYATVFCTGAAVMIIELLGTRLIAPFYGASLYVWSAQISVTMIALACGYYLGGWWADRPGRAGLALIVAIAGILTLLIPWLARPVLLATDDLGLRGGAFVSALALFFPSLFFLGMVGPFAIKLGTETLEGLGTRAGSIYAVSTLGSVIGTLVLGFYLFPRVGSRSILLGLGWALLLLAMLVAFMEGRARGRLRMSHAYVCLVCLCLAAVFTPMVVDAGSGSEQNSRFHVQAEQESLYGWVRVVDFADQDIRTLMSDASTIGAATIKSGQNLLSYQAIVDMLPAIQPRIRKALLVGQGAGHMAMTLRSHYGIETDTLEIDPAVAEAATRYFGFSPTGKAVVGDARYEMRRLSGPYDLIIMDCFTGGSEPSHLLTVETLEHLRGMLSKDGILALNFVAFADQGHNPALASVAKTLAQVFGHQTVFVSEPGDDFNDFIFLASERPVDVSGSGLSTEQLAWLRQRAFQVDQGPGTVLTDDFNPLEHLQARKSERYRETMVEWYGRDMLIR